MHHQTFSLKWNSYSNHLKEAMKELLQTGTFSDVTIVCDDQVGIAAHKFVLRTCSSAFRDIIDKDSVMYVKGVNHNEFMLILEFIYLGQVHCNQELLPKFLNLANDLQLKDIKLMAEGELKDTTELVTDVATKIETNSETYGEDLNKDEIIKPTTPMENDISHQYLTFPVVKDNEPMVLHDQNLEYKDILSRKQNRFKSIENGKSKDTKNYGNDPACCPLCDAKYVHRQGLRRHIESKHEGKRICCNYCDYKATQESDLKKHTDSVHNGLKFPCGQCNFKASRLDGLKSHAKKRHLHTY